MGLFCREDGTIKPKYSDSRQIKELSTLAFVKRAENVVFLGPPGVGKTHLAVGLGMQALRNGMTSYYITTAQLIADLKKAEQQGKLERRWKVYLKPDLLIVDEVGYMQLDRHSAELLFRLICSRYERGSIVLTSNKYFSEWGELMSDTVIATAILDRLLHHAHVINIRGDSYRIRQRQKSGLMSVPPADIPAMEIPANK